MTAQGSKTRNRLLEYYLYRLGTIKFFLIAMIIAALLSYPLYLAGVNNYAMNCIDNVQMPDIVTRFYFDETGLGYRLLIWMMAGEVIMSAVIPLFGFRSLLRKKYVNMELSLPVSHKQRFFGDLLASGTAVFAPQLGAGIIGYLMCGLIRAYRFPLPPGIEEGAGYEMSVVPDYISRVETVEKLIPTLITVSFMVLCTAVLIISVSGKVFPALLMTVAVNIVIPFSILYILNAAYSFYGMYYEGYVPSPVAPFSALGFMVYVSQSNDSVQRKVLTGIFALLIHAGVLVLSYFLQKHRMANRTGEPFVYRHAKHVFAGLAVFTIWVFVVGGLNTRFIDGSQVVVASDILPTVSGGLIFSLIVFTILELIGGQRLKRFGHAAAAYGISAAAALAACFLMSNTGGFGAEWYIPPESAVEKVGLYMTNPFDSSLPEFEVPYSDAAALHRKILKDHPEPVPQTWESRYGNGSHIYSVDTPEVRFYYILKDGTKVTRRYEIYTGMTGEIYELMFANNYPESLYQLSEEYSGIVSGRFLSVKYTSHKCARYVMEDTTAGLNMTDVPVEAFMEALQADARDATFEQFYRTPYRGGVTFKVSTNWVTPESSPYYTGIRSTSEERLFTVYPFFERTLALLKEYGIEPDFEPRVDEAYFFEEPYAGFTVNPTYLNEFLPSDVYDRRTQELSDNYRIDPDSDRFRELLDMSAPRAYFEGRRGRYMLVIKNIFNGYEFYSVTEDNLPRAAELCR